MTAKNKALVKPIVKLSNKRLPKGELNEVRVRTPPTIYEARNNWLSAP